MVIYVDILLILNFYFDFNILITLSYILKRKLSLKRIIMASFFGELSIILLLNNYPYFILILSKILMAIFINIIAFGYRSLKYVIINILYFYMLSSILGGIILLFKKEHLYILGLVLAPLFTYIFYKTYYLNKIKYQRYYDLEIHFLNKRKINIKGYMDSGNNLQDKISHKIVIIVNKEVLKGKINIRAPAIYVPYKTINNYGLLKCYKIAYIIINNKRYTNILVAIANEKITIDGIDCLLNRKLEE